ncbi:MAG TPA: 30S ribosomal protein S20 [Firmicutes bacterium]|uniref:Small ribosomal subunit protein bS20 n=1 Tax=Capillibacterium thermochitinicola TaxID=2699427 RepID=A0A8J6LM07_9FIRM|nr:30S ribosomal protein S20 [Capillibacterium thermochitinicola]MBA2133129.1 30S ribosomal protein S20 [Capillibacterium thermochitinicola]HHW11820.1 30S ribosomal protein S20 [Bacillota bacterium]
MPNIKSAEKRVAVSEVRRLRNRSQRSKLRTLIKNTQLAMETDLEKAQNLLTLTIKELDQAASKGLIHKNAAARKKSRLMRKFNQRTAAVNA